MRKSAHSMYETVSIDDDDSGMFSVTFTIPPDQEYGQRQNIQLINEENQYNIEMNSEERFLIADPRLPSAVMTLDAPEYVLLPSSGAAPSHLRGQLQEPSSGAASR